MDLVIIFTPLQYLNALAYKKQFNKECKFIVLTTEERNIEQIALLDKDMYCMYPLRKMHFSPDDILWFIKLLYAYIFISTKKYSKIIIGNYNNVVGFCLALKFQRHNKDIIFIDDGLATVGSYRERNEKKVFRSSRLFGGRIIYILRYLLKDKYLYRVIFYTSFDLESVCEPQYDIVIKQEIIIEDKNIVYNNEIWFIGSPLIESNIIDKKIFYEIMVTLRDYAKYHNLEFKYIHHRFEKVKDDFNSVKFDLPIEVILNESEILPNEIVSFYSSAIINIASLYPQIKCSYINLYKTDAKKYERLESIYKLFESHNNLKEFEVK